MAGETITIMADFGNGPYAWKKRTCEGCASVGPNIADATCGLSHVIGSSAELDDDLAAWVVGFERRYDDPQFDWAAFHSQGVALATRLKGEVKDTFDVAYCPPHEDPLNGKMPAIAIESA